MKQTKTSGQKRRVAGDDNDDSLDLHIIYCIIYKEDEKGETEQQVAYSLPKLSVKRSTFLRGTYIVLYYVPHVNLKLFSLTRSFTFMFESSRSYNWSLLAHISHIIRSTVRKKSGVRDVIEVNGDHVTV